MNQGDNFWDPFVGQINVPKSSIDEKKATISVPNFVKYAWAVLLPIGLIGFCIIIFAQDTLWKIGGAAAFCISIAVPLLVDHLAGGQSNKKRNLESAANSLGFRSRRHISSARLDEISRVIHPLLTLKIGSAIPLPIDFEMWGKTQNGTDQWIGANLVDSLVLLNGPKAQTIGEKGGSGFGNMAIMIAAYPLERDTGVTVSLFPEFKTPLGPLEFDIQTESVEFNNIFNIRLEAKDGEKTARTMSAKLLQVLTPAFQATLIELAEHFSTRIIIKGSTVYFAGYKNLVSTDQSEIEHLLQVTVAAFSEAAVSFKRYAE